MTAKLKQKCPYCGGTHLWKVGPRVSVSKGKQVRYQCQNPSCAHTFFESVARQPKKVKGG